MNSRQESATARALIRDWVQRETTSRKVERDKLVGKLGSQNADNLIQSVKASSKATVAPSYQMSPRDAQTLQKHASDADRAKKLKDQNAKQRESARRIHDQQEAKRLRDLEHVRKVIHKHDGSQLQLNHRLTKGVHAIHDHNRRLNDQQQFSKRTERQKLNQEADKLAKQQKLETWQLEYSPLREQFPKVRAASPLSPKQQKAPRAIDKTLIDTVSYNRLLGGKKVPTTSPDDEIAHIALQLALGAGKGKSNQTTCLRSSIPFK
eukprot:TRINITY_DN19743_c0_g1_i1.p1 TRINITY_DN19743_c0_g1~~TRINITY_DN19743_c0_g1_i1.p1  ORF type:complete len:264 (+),score=48.44 TRINITY_DN19743_c0_g1_i1:123-914(+)